MDVPDRAEREPEPISVARCQEQLGKDADTLSDEEVLSSRATQKRLGTAVSGYDLSSRRRAICVLSRTI